MCCGGSGVSGTMLFFLLLLLIFVCRSLPYGALTLSDVTPTFEGVRCGEPLGMASKPGHLRVYKDMTLLYSEAVKWGTLNVWLSIDNHTWAAWL